MVKFQAKVIDPIGLHARPASAIVSTASKFQSDLKIVHQERSGNLKSIMNIMALNVKTGQVFTVTAEGPDAEEALAAVKNTMIDTSLIEE